MVGLDKRRSFQQPIVYALVSNGTIIIFNNEASASAL
jgi:hypothetical protein